MRGFALLELLIIVAIIGLLAWLFIGATRPSLFTPATPSQAQEGANAIKQAQDAAHQFNSSTDQL